MHQIAQSGAYFAAPGESEYVEADEDVTVGWFGLVHYQIMI